MKISKKSSFILAERLARFGQSLVITLWKYFVITLINSSSKMEQRFADCYHEWKNNNNFYMWFQYEIPEGCS